MTQHQLGSSDWTTRVISSMAASCSTESSRAAKVTAEVLGRPIGGFTRAAVRRCTKKRQAAGSGCKLAAIWTT
eukprot:8828017-Pyramimonas_sp.AAC.1